MNCKFCGSENVIKYGTYGGVQLYFCKDCGSKFKDDDTTFHMKTPANQVTSALNMWYEGMSIKGIARNLKQEHGNMPSTATIYEWIQKYTQYAIDSIKDYKPEKVGDTWVADETVIEIDGNNVWLWDIIDYDTRFLLATRISRSRTTQDAQMLYDRAVKMAGKEPEKVMRFHSTLKQRTKVMRGLKNIQSAIDFMDGFFVHYNYLRPHTFLDDKTPAEVAGIDYPYANWADIIRKHKPSKPVIIEHQPRDRVKLPVVQVGRPQKRRRYRRKLPTTPTTMMGLRVKR